MKKILNQTMVALVAVTGLAASVSQAQADAIYEWDFRSAAKVAAPETGGKAQATVMPGTFSAAWNSGSAAFGNIQGFWDLGKNGSITIQTPEATPVAGEARVVTVKIVEYEDGMIYDQFATVSVPGATLIGCKMSDATTTLLGQWTVSETQWSVNPGAAGDSVLIDGAEFGTLVDRVTVASTASAAVTGPALRIRELGSSVEISWPVGDDQLVLERNVSLSNSMGWVPVNEPAVIKDGMRSVTVDAASAAGFYRLKQ